MKNYSIIEDSMEDFAMYDEGMGRVYFNGEQQFVKAEVAEKLLEALKDMVSITKIAQAEYCESFAWTELAYSEEVLNYSEEN